MPERHGMSSTDQPITDQHRVWDDWAQADPLWAILSDPAHKGGKWDLDEFFATGRQDIASLRDEIAARGLTHGTGRCLDFGCGVGRLTQALGDVFDTSDGVDISETMVELARQYNRHGERCSYHVNLAPDLSLFADNTFDLVYSTLVLQHNAPEMAEHYIAEFGRILAPGGLAVFDMPAAFIKQSVPLPANSHRARLEITNAPSGLGIGETATVDVTITNISTSDWPAWHQVRLGNHWMAPDGTMLLRDDGRTGWDTGLAAGESVSVSVTVTAPAQAGKLGLAIDLVEEGVSWFGDLGSQVVTTPVAVRNKLGFGARVLQRLQSTPAQPTAAEPAPFTMNALSQDAVAAAVARHGCRIADLRPADSAGPEWETYRYFVQKAGPEAG